MTGVVLTSVEGVMYAQRPEGPLYAAFRRGRGDYATACRTREFGWLPGAAHRTMRAAESHIRRVAGDPGCD